MGCTRPGDAGPTPERCGCDNESDTRPLASSAAPGGRAQAARPVVWGAPSSAGGRSPVAWMGAPRRRLPGAAVGGWDGPAARGGAGAEGGRELGARLFVPNVPARARGCDPRSARAPRSGRRRGAGAVGPAGRQDNDLPMMASCQFKKQSESRQLPSGAGWAGGRSSPRTARNSD